MDAARAGHAERVDVLWMTDVDPSMGGTPGTGLMSATWQDGQWSGNRLVDPHAPGDINHVLGFSYWLDASGEGTAIWGDDGGKLRIANKLIGREGRWTPARTIGDAGSHLQGITSAFGLDGSACIGWIKVGGVAAVCRAGADEAWSGGEKVSDWHGTWRQTLPDLAVDGAGNAYLAWMQTGPSEETRIQFATRPAGAATWGAAETVLTQGDVAPYGVKVLAGASGSAWLAWIDSGRSIDPPGARMGPGLPRLRGRISPGGPGFPLVAAPPGIFAGRPGQGRRPGQAPVLRYVPLDQRAAGLPVGYGPG